MKKRFDFPAVLLFSALTVEIGGCGAGSVQPHEQPVIRVEKIDPFEFGDEFAYRTKGIGVETFTEDQAAGIDIPSSREKLKKITVSPTEIPSAAPVEPERPDERRQGEGITVYRVQIGIFEEQKYAEQRAEEARSKVDDKVYIDFEPPFYRVRVGDFKTRKEAQEYVKILQNLGFHGSFWIMKNAETP